MPDVDEMYQMQAMVLGILRCVADQQLKLINMAHPFLVMGCSAQSTLFETAWAFSYLGYARLSAEAM